LVGFASKLMARLRSVKRDNRTFQHAQRTAINALLDLWRSAIRMHLRVRGHRTPSEAKVSAMLLALSKDQIVWPLFIGLRYVEDKLGKKYSA
jgi:hypothetical protein